MRIGTRGSPLALAQARELKSRLAAAHGVDGAGIEIVVIKTTGDAITDRALSEAGGKGLFTKELDLALMRGEVDIAVHSAKDVPTLLPDEIVILGYLAARGRARRLDIAACGASARACPRRRRRHGLAAPRRHGAAPAP